MHEFRRFIQEQIDARGWSPSELARRSGLRTQHVSQLLGDDRERLLEMPRPATVSALATAFGMAEGAVLLVAARAYGIPVDAPVQIPTAGAISDDELLQELASRLRTRHVAPGAATLDLNAMAHAALPKIIDLAQSLADDAIASDSRGEPDLATAQRFLAAQLDAAVEAVAPTNDQRQRDHPQQHA